MVSNHHLLGIPRCFGKRKDPVREQFSVSLWATPTLVLLVEMVPPHQGSLDCGHFNGHPFSGPLDTFYLYAVLSFMIVRSYRVNRLTRPTLDPFHGL